MMSKGDTKECWTRAERRKTLDGTTPHCQRRRESRFEQGSMFHDSRTPSNLVTALFYEEDFNFSRYGLSRRRIIHLQNITSHFRDSTRVPYTLPPHQIYKQAFPRFCRPAHQTLLAYAERPILAL